MSAEQIKITEDARVRVVLPAMDIIVTPGLVTQLTKALPTLARVAERSGQPIKVRFEDHPADSSGDLRVMLLEVGDDVSVPIALRAGATEGAS